MTKATMDSAISIRWAGDARNGVLELLDQRRLPAEEVWLTIDSAEATADAIRDMVVRGAPAIGLTAAYGIVLAAQAMKQQKDGALTVDRFEAVFGTLGASRPTAVNLHWAIDRLRSLLASDEPMTVARIHAEAEAIRTEDIAANQAMGALGADLLPARANILTHCNTGALATAGHGTALGIIRTAYAQGKLQHVYASETRPYLQGARLTMWELLKDNIPATLITDSMAGYVMQQGDVDAVIVGADRIAANGDTANKIGTYALAVLCKHHNIPFYVAAPLSTIDLDTPDGSGIPIEMRAPTEVTRIKDVAIAPPNADALHPAFDVTPNTLITAIVTENGVVKGEYIGGLRELVD